MATTARLVLLILSLSCSVAQAGTQLVPSLLIQERYDTNVLRRDSRGATFGVQREDFVTTMFPHLLLKSRDGVVDVNAVVGTRGEVYVENPGLNYVGANGAVGIGLTPLVSSVVRNMTMNVNGTVLYTPTLPAFLRPDQDSPFLTGIQFFRSNTLYYSAGGDSVYRMTPTVFVQSRYRFSKIKFLTTSAAPGIGLIGTTNHVFSITPGKQVSPNDTITSSYSANFFEQDNRNSFRTHIGTIGWAHKWSQNLSSQLSGGGQYLEPRTVLTGSQSANLSGVIIPTGSVSITYGSNAQILGDIANTSGRLMNLEMWPGADSLGGITSTGNYSFTVSYSFRTFPLLVQNGGLMNTHAFGLIANVGLTNKLTAFGGGNFSRSDASGGNFSYEALAGNVGLNYLITPSLRADLQYTYYNSYPLGGGLFFAINRQSVTLGLTYAFEGGSQFFQGSGFGQGFFGSEEEKK